MSRSNRIHARKRVLPDWVLDDDTENSRKLQTSSAPNSDRVCLPSDVTANDELDSTSTSTTHKQNEKNDESEVPRVKKPFSRPNYEYLPGNKHNQNQSASNPEVQEPPVISADDMVAQAMPFVKFNGSVIYSYNVGDCSMLCEEIMGIYLTEDNSSVINVGFDLEWPVSYVKGEGGGKVALVQLCVSESKCYLFHVSAIGSFPKSLKKLIEDDRIMKIGVNIETDMWKLVKDFDFEARRVIKNSMLDLGKFANTKLKSKENWGLEGLCRNVLRMRMDKDSSVRCGKWDDFPLGEEQKMYAATDAYACLRIFNTLDKDMGQTK